MKKSMGIGANISILKRLIHPSIHVRAKYVNIEQDDRLSGCLVTGKCTKYVTRREQQIITFHRDAFKNVILYVVERCCQIEEEGPTESFSISNEAAVVDNEHEMVSDYEEENIN